MPTNIGFDNGHPYVEEGADDGDLSLINGRVSITSANSRAIMFTIDRSVDGGVTWEPVLDDTLPGNGANLTDWESLSNGETLYRAVAFTVEGATAETIVTVAAGSEALWLSGGSAFGLTGRLPLNPSVGISAGRARALKQYAGRSHPVAIVGEALARTVQVSGMTADNAIGDETTADVEQLTQISQSEEPVFLFRDPYGRRVYGAIDSIDVNHKTASDDNGFWDYSFTLVETER